MIKVAYIVSQLNRVGPNYQLYYLCKYLNQEKIKMTIITTSIKKADNTLHDDLNKIGVEIIELNLGKLNSIVRARKIIQNIINQNQIEVIHSLGFRSEMIACGLKDVFKITTIRNRPLFTYRIIYGFIAGTILCKIHLCFVKQFDKIVACSKSVSEDIRLMGIESTIITNAFDTSIIKDNIIGIDKSTIRAKLNLPKDKMIYITISSNEPVRKNIEFVIKSFQNVEQFKTCILLVAGFVKKKTIKSTYNLPNIILLGNVSNIFNYYKASNYFISASLSEGMPNAVLESMSVGTPLILSDIPSHKEIFEICKSNIGVIFKNNNLPDLKEQINKVMLYDYRLLSNNCIKEMKNCFSAYRMAKKYEDLYQCNCDNRNDQKHIR